MQANHVSTRMRDVAVPLPCVAVVEDEQSVRNALGRLLRSAGFAVRSFGSGAALLESLLELEPSCIVLDLHMPPPNGFDVLQILQDAGKSHTVVVISADSSSQNRARAFAAGARTFLAKPVDDVLLLDAVNGVMQAQERGR
jgi:FixJ family two-component response regulator